MGAKAGEVRIVLAVVRRRSTWSAVRDGLCCNAQRNKIGAVGRVAGSCEARMNGDARRVPTSEEEDDGRWRWAMGDGAA